MVSSISVLERGSRKGGGGSKVERRKCLGESKVLLSHLHAPQVQELRAEWPPKSPDSLPSTSLTGTLSGSKPQVLTEVAIGKVMVQVHLVCLSQVYHLRGPKRVTHGLLQPDLCHPDSPASGPAGQVGEI